MFKIYTQKIVEDLKERINALQKQINESNERLNEHTGALTKIYSISKDIASCTDLQLLLEKSLKILTEISGADRGMFLLEDSGSYSLVHSLNIEEESKQKYSFSYDNDIVKLLKNVKQSIIAREVKKKIDVLKDENNKILIFLKPDILIPLYCRGQINGIISLGYKDAHKKITEEDLSLIDFLASQISVAVTSAQLHNKLEVSNKELYSKIFELVNLHRVSEAMSSSLDIDRLKQLTIDIFSEVTRTDKSVLFLRDEMEMKMVPVLWKALNQESLQGLEFSNESEFIKTLMKQKQPILIQRSEIQKSFSAYQIDSSISGSLEKLGLVLYIPFVSKDKLVALLATGEKISGEQFAGNELELLGILSCQAAITIDNAKLSELSVIDGLTKAFIHRYFQQQLEHRITVGINYMSRRIISLIMADIDHFKNVNDTHGHQVGDQVLRDIASIIMNNVRVADMVARYGGEEFAVILPEIDLDEAAAMAEKVRQRIESFTFLPETLKLKVTVSFGVASLPQFAKTKDELINLADKALYKSKALGRNKVTLCNNL